MIVSIMLGASIIALVAVVACGPALGRLILRFGRHG